MTRFSVGQEVLTASGTLYRVHKVLDVGAHSKLKGESGYGCFGRRNGQDFGPYRLLRESAVRAAPLNADFTPD